MCAPPHQLNGSFPDDSCDDPGRHHTNHSDDSGCAVEVCNDGPGSRQR